MGTSRHPALPRPKPRPNAAAEDALSGHQSEGCRSRQMVAFLGFREGCSLYGAGADHLRRRRGDPCPCGVHHAGSERAHDESQAGPPRRTVSRTRQKARPSCAGRRAPAGRGAWPACIENFDALVRYYVDEDDTETAEAYLRKLLFVSDYAHDRPTQATVQVTALSTYLKLERVDAAAAIVRKAGDIAKLRGRTILEERRRTGWKDQGRPCRQRQS